MSQRGATISLFKDEEAVSTIRVQRLVEESMFGGESGRFGFVVVDIDNREHKFEVDSRSLQLEWVESLQLKQRPYENTGRTPSISPQRIPAVSVVKSPPRDRKTVDRVAVSDIFRNEPRVLLDAMPKVVVETGGGCDNEEELESLKEMIQQLNAQISCLTAENRKLEQAKLENVPVVQPRIHEENDYLERQLSFIHSKISQLLKVSEAKVETAPDLNLQPQLFQLSQDLQIVSKNVSIAQTSIESTARRSDIMALLHNFETFSSQIAALSNHQPLREALDGIGSSLQKITEFLAKNVTLQSQTDKIMHNKLDAVSRTDLKSSLDSLKADIATFGKQMVISAPQKNGLSEENIVRAVRERTSELVQMYKIIETEVKELSKNQKSAGSNEQNLKVVEGQLQRIESTLAEMEIFAKVPHRDVGDHDEQLKNFMSKVSSVSDNLEMCQSGLHKIATRLDQPPTVVAPATDEVVRIVRDIQTKVNGLSLIPTRVAPVEEPPRSRSPHRDAKDYLLEEKLGDIQRAVHNIKEKVSSVSKSETGSTALQVNSVLDVCDKIFRSLKSFQDSYDSNDQAWRTELRQSIRFDHEKLVGIERDLRKLSDTSSVPSLGQPTLDSILRKTTDIQNNLALLKDSGTSVKEAPSIEIKELLKESLSELGTMLEENFTHIGEGLESMQTTFQKELSVYSSSLTNLLQDRELLMRENQKLISMRRNNSTDSATSSAEDLKPKISAEKEWLASLASESAALAAKNAELTLQLQMKQADLDQVTEKVASYKAKKEQLSTDMKTCALELSAKKAELQTLSESVQVNRAELGKTADQQQELERHISMLQAQRSSLTMDLERETQMLLTLQAVNTDLQKPKKSDQLAEISVEASKLQSDLEGRLTSLYMEAEDLKKKKRVLLNEVVSLERSASKLRRSPQKSTPIRQRAHSFGSYRPGKHGFDATC